MDELYSVRMRAAQGGPQVTGATILLELSAWGP